MAHNQQYGGYPPPQGPPQGGGWNQPPPNQQQWGGHHPPPGAPPNQQQWGGHQPPPGPPPQWNSGPNNFAPPQGAPPNQQWQQPQGPPPGQWGGQHQQWGPPSGPPPGQFGPSSGAPPQGGLGAPGQPSFGYVPGQTAQGWNAVPDANALRSAMKGFGTREGELIKVLAPLDPLQVNSVRQTYSQVHKGRDLEKDIDSETSRYFKEALLSIVRGPLIQDAHNVREAVKGVGTNEDLLNHVVLGRSNADLRAIKETYQRMFNRRLEEDVDADLSMKTKDLFRIILRAKRAEENAPFDPQQVDRDVAELQRALNSTGEQSAVCNVIALRSDGQLRAIAHAFQQKGRKSLRESIEKKYGGHMEDALLLMLDRALDPVMSDAVHLEKAMAGAGTKDRLLVARTITVHWNKAHRDQVKRAYQQRYKRDLLERIRGETSGDYRNILVACMT